MGFLARLLFALALALILGSPVFIAAIAVQTLTYAFPLPDFLFLGLAVSTRLASTSRTWPGVGRLADLDFDLERILITTIENATRSVQGMFLSVFIGLGLLLSAGNLYLAVNTVPLLGGLVGIDLSNLRASWRFETLLALWNWFGVVFLLTCGGMYGIWVWIREFARLPYFLDEWEQREKVDSIETVSRPTGFVLPTVVCFGLVIPFAYFAKGLVKYGFAILWLPVLLTVLWLVWHSRRRAPQGISNEQYWIVSGLALQVFSLWTGARFDSLVEAMSTDRSVLSVLSVPIAVTALVVVISVIPTMFSHDHEYENYRRYGFVGLLVAIGTLAVIGYFMLPPAYQQFAAVFALIGWISGIVLMVVRYFDL